jgi:hypothetical protein
LCSMGMRSTGSIAQHTAPKIHRVLQPLDMLGALPTQNRVM